MYTLAWKVLEVFHNTATQLKLFGCRFFYCAVTPKIIVDFELFIILPSHGHFVIIKRPKTNKKHTSSGFNHLHHNIRSMISKIPILILKLVHTSGVFSSNQLLLRSVLHAHFNFHHRMKDVLSNYFCRDYWIQCLIAMKHNSLRHVIQFVWSLYCTCFTFIDSDFPLCSSSSSTRSSNWRKAHIV